MGSTIYLIYLGVILFYFAAYAYSKRPAERRSRLLTACFRGVRVILVLVVIAHFSFFAYGLISLPFRKMTAEGALKEAQATVAKAGGADKIHAAASEVFKRFGNSHASFMKADLQDFPELTALGHVTSISYSSGRPCISIMVRTRIDGYSMDVFDPRDSEARKPPDGWSQVSEFIFVAIPDAE